MQARTWFRRLTNLHPIDQTQHTPAQLTRRTIRIGCGTIAAVVALSFALIAAHWQSRYLVKTPVDRGTGIGIEYSISSRYQQHVDDEAESRHNKHDGVRDWEFSPSTRSPLERWIFDHIPGRLKPLADSDGGGPISQTCSLHSGMTGLHTDTKGFVTIDGIQLTLASVVSQEYKMIGDCPTTLVIEDSDLIINGHPMQYCDLLIRPKGQSTIYMFQTTKLEGEERHLSFLELKAIRESVRVFKKM
jgi:hypothetical protein